MPKLFAISPNDFKVAYLEDEMDLPESERIKWHIKILTVEQIGKIEEIFTNLQGDDTLSGGQIDALKQGLSTVIKGWENFTFSDGTPVKFEEYKDKLHQIVDIKVATQIFGLALTSNVLSEEDKGN